MLHTLVNLIIKNTGYIAEENYTTRHQDNDYIIEFPVTGTDTIIVNLYKDGYWVIINLEDYTTIADGKATPLANGNWINRLIRAGYAENYAFAVHVEIKRLAKRK